MLTIPEYKREVGVTIPMMRHDYFKGFNDKFFFRTYTLVPRISFQWIIQNVDDLSADLSINLVSQKANELDIQTTEVLQMYNSDPLSMGIEFHESMIGFRNQVSIPRNIKPDYEQYRDFFARLNTSDPPEEIKFSGRFLRFVMSRHGYLFVTIFDPDKYYHCEVIKDTTKNKVYFLVDDEEASRRARLVASKRMASTHSDLWNGIVETMLVADYSNFREIARDYGMMIPPIFTDIKDEMSYFNQHFYEHSQQQKSDFDLIYKSGIIVYFQTPTELRQKISRVCRRNAMEFFIIITESVLTKSVNKTLTTLETLIEAAPDIIIGYGSRTSYRSFSPIELLSSFSENPLDARFIKPYNHNEEFDEGEVEKIKDLLSFFEKSSSIAKEAFDRIDTILKYRAELTEDIRDFLRKYQTSGPEYKEDFKNLIINIFYAGMYMRQWRGPEHPFPVTGLETRYYFDHDSQEFYVGVTKHMTEVMSLLSKLNCIYLNRLHVKSYSNYYYNYGYRLNDFLTNVHTGEYCIRMASLPLVSSAVFYSTLLKGDYLPKISLDGFESIL